MEAKSEQAEGLAVRERQFLSDDIKWLKASAKLISPGGEDISGMKLESLEVRLAQVESALGDDCLTAAEQSRL